MSNSNKTNGYQPTSNGSGFDPCKQSDMLLIPSTNPPKVEWFVDYRQMAHEVAMEHIRRGVWTIEEIVDEYTDVYFKILKRLEEPYV